MADAPEMPQQDPWDAKTEEAFALAMRPLVERLLTGVRDQLPPGTTCGVLFFAPPVEGMHEGRIICASTDPSAFAHYALHWVKTRLPAQAAAIEPKPAPIIRPPPGGFRHGRR